MSEALKQRSKQEVTSNQKTSENQRQKCKIIVIMLIGIVFFSSARLGYRYVLSSMQRENMELARANTTEVKGASQEYTDEEKIADLVDFAVKDLKENNGKFIRSNFQVPEKDDLERQLFKNPSFTFDIRKVNKRILTELTVDGYRGLTDEEVEKMQLIRGMQESIKYGFDKIDSNGLPYKPSPSSITYGVHTDSGYMLIYSSRLNSRNKSLRSSLQNIDKSLQGWSKRYYTEKTGNSWEEFPQGIESGSPE